MGKAVVIAGPDDRKLIGLTGHVRKQIGYFETGLPMLAEGPFRAEHNGFSKLSILKIFVAEARRRMLAVELGQQRLRIESVHLARSTLHEQRDHTFGGSGQWRRFRG